MELFSFLFGGGNTGRGWVEAALLIGLFWAALAHPERIRSTLSYRLSALCLGLALTAPSIIQALLMSRQTPTGQIDNRSMLIIAAAIPPVLTTLAILLGLSSVLPSPARGR